MSQQRQQYHSVNSDGLTHSASTSSSASSSSSHSHLLSILLIITLHACSVSLILTPLTDLVSDVIYSGNISRATLFLSVLEAVIAIMQFFTDPFWGWMSDQEWCGRKPPLLLAICQFSFEMLLLYIYPSLMTLIFLGVLRGLCGVGFTICSILLMDLAGSSIELGPVLLGYYGAASGLGFILGSFASVIIGGTFGLHAPFLCAAMVEVVNAGVVLWRVPRERMEQMEEEAGEEGEGGKPTESSPLLVNQSARPTTAATTTSSSSSSSSSISHSPLPSFTLLFSTPSLFYLSLTFFLVFTGRGYGRILLFYTKYLWGWQMRENGLALGWIGIVAVIVQGLGMKRLVTTIGETNTVYLALTMNIAAALAFAFLPSTTTGVVLFYVMTLVTSVSFLLLPLVRAMMSREIIVDGEKQQLMKAEQQEEEQKYSTPQQLSSHSAPHKIATSNHIITNNNNNQQQGLLGGMAASLVTAANGIGALIYGVSFAYFIHDGSDSSHPHPPHHAAEDSLSNDNDSNLPILPHLPPAPFLFPGAPFLLSAILLIATIPIVRRAMRLHEESMRKRTEKQNKRNNQDSATAVI